MATAIGVDPGEALEFDPGDGNTLTFGAPQSLQTIDVNDGTITAVSGTTILDSTLIQVGLLQDVNFAGDGDLTVKQGFGNGGTPITDNFLNHYGFDRTGDDRESLNLHLNGGALNGGSPTTYVDFTGEALLISGPQGNGLNFDNDGDFTGTGAIDQNDNYKNLFIGYLNTTETGDFEFRNSDRDDWATTWIDIDQDGVFESTTGNLGSNNGEQLAWNDNGTKTVNLTNPLGTGRYLVAFTHLEGGGGSRIEYQFKLPSMGAQAVINPGDPAQAGLWSGFASITPDTNVNKTGAGALTLAGDNTFSGAVNLNSGSVIAAHDDAFGLDGGDVILAAGASVGFQQDMLGGDIVVDGDDIIGGDGQAAGQAGTISNLNGANQFLGDITATTAGVQELTIASVAGSLTLGQVGANTLDVHLSKLSFAGAGDVIVNSDIVAASVAEQAEFFQAYLFTGNDTDLPGDVSQIASTAGAGEVWFPQEANSLAFWGDDLLDVGNAGNPTDPNNWAATYIAELTIPGVGTQNIRLRHTSADDAARIRIDLNQNDVFEGGGEDPCGADRGGNFTTGEFAVDRGVPIPVALQMREGGGASRIQPEISFDNGGSWHRFDTAGIDVGGVDATFGFFLSPADQLMKSGAGTVTLNGDNGADAAEYSVLEGKLIATTDTALGSAAGGTKVSTGAVLELQDVSNLQESMTFGDPVTIAPSAPGLTVTGTVQLTSTQPVTLTVLPVGGATFNATNLDLIYGYAGTGLPGPDNIFTHLKDGVQIDSQPASAAVNDTIAFTLDASTLMDAHYSIGTDTNRTPIIWQGDISSDWNTGGNWVGDVVPGLNNIAVFNDPDSVSNAVDLSSSGPVGAVSLENAAESFTFTGGTLLTNALSQVGTGTTTFDSTAPDRLQQLLRRRRCRTACV